MRKGGVSFDFATHPLMNYVDRKKLTLGSASSQVRFAMLTVSSDHKALFNHNALQHCISYAVLPLRNW